MRPECHNNLRHPQRNNKKAKGLNARTPARHRRRTTTIATHLIINNFTFPADHDLCPGVVRGCLVPRHDQEPQKMLNYYQHSSAFRSGWRSFCYWERWSWWSCWFIKEDREIFSDGWIWKVSAIRKVRIHHLAMGYYFDSTDSSTIPPLSWKWMAKKPSLPSATQSQQTTNPLYKTLHPNNLCTMLLFFFFVVVVLCWALPTIIYRWESPPWAYILGIAHLQILLFTTRTSERSFSFSRSFNAFVFYPSPHFFFFFIVIVGCPDATHFFAPIKLWKFTCLFLWLAPAKCTITAEGEDEEAQSV